MDPFSEESPVSIPNQPDDKNVERGALAPPWKRGETSVATGLTAGELAKAAGVVDDDRTGPSTGGPAPRGVVAGDSPRAEQKPPQSSPPSPQGPPAPQGPQAGTQGPGPVGPQGKPDSGPNPKIGPAPAPAQGPAPMPQRPVTAGPPSGPMPAQQPPKAAPAPPAAAPSPAPSKPAPFVESDTRNIPRERLADKDQLPDLDSIHHTEKAKEQAIARASSQTIPARASGAPLRAAVQIRRVDPWSIFKVAGVLCVAGFFIWMIAVAILYGVLGGMGIWDQINSSFGTLVSADGSTSGQDLISGGQVFMFSALFGVASSVLLTALATISAYIYNVCADFVGGVEITLADLD
ncbi:MAG: DUF3566 domain-containing protein [Gordonia sp.]|nr:DUF3566 domain-containing protein [Gordonia sp. (in: high G+C Gram-positive bacteria)]